MKAWRKHNQLMQAQKKELLEEREILSYLDQDSPTIKDLDKKIKHCEFQHLTRKEARTHFAAEVATPSQLLYLLFAHIGLPTPPEFKESVMRHVKSQPKSA